MQTSQKRIHDERERMHEAAATLIAQAQGMPKPTHVPRPSKKSRLLPPPIFPFTLPTTVPNADDFPQTERQQPPSAWFDSNLLHQRFRFDAWNTLTWRAKSVQRALTCLQASDGSNLSHIRNILDALSFALEHRVYTNVDHLLEDEIVTEAFDAVCKLREMFDRPQFDSDSSPSSVNVCEHLRSEIYEEIVSTAGYTKCTLHVPVSMKPKFKITSARDERHSLPQATITVTTPCSHLFPSEEDGDDASVVATWFQTIFDQEADDFSEQDRDMAARLAEGITQAMHSRTGFGVVYNHNEAIFLQVVGLEPVLRERIVVRVSRLFRCDEDLSTLFGIAALFQVVEMRGSARKLFDGEVFACVRMLNCAGAGLMNPTITTRREYNSEESDEGDGDCTERSEEESRDGDNDGHESRNRVEPNAENEESQIVRQWTDDALTSRVFKESCGVLGSGGCGMVKKSVEGDRKLALKYWNQRHSTGEELLLREIRLYCMLATKYGHIMDVALPRLIAVGIQDWIGAVLVIERVGEHVKSCHGRLQVGGRQITTADCQQLRDSAVKGLQVLHSCGVIHRDVEVRNLRAERVGDGDEDGFWRTWWVDLGLAKFSKDAERMKREIGHCKRIFDFGYKEGHPVVP